MRINSNLLFFVLIICFAQLKGQKSESWKVYDDTQIAVIRITMEESDKQWMFENPESDSMHFAQVHFRNAVIDEVIDSVGVRLRGNTSREANKKSLKLSFNTFVKGGDFYSFEKLNLNGEHNDPSIVRSKLCWDFFNDIDIVSSRAAHAIVFINNLYYGLYISIEHIDEEFIDKNYKNDSGNLWKCLFGANLTYLGSNPDLYKFENNEGKRPYALITNEDSDDYSQLGRFIDVINNSPSAEFEDSLEAILKVNDVLKYFATNILVGGWDDYWSLSNNYYLYYNPKKEKFSLIPYDYDNTFGITWWDTDWANVNPYTFAQVVPGPRPLVDRIMQSAKYRNLYSHFLQFYSQNYFNTGTFLTRLTNHKNLLKTYAEVDTFRIPDWGFSYDDFLNSYDQPEFFFQNNIIIPRSIKGFVEDRTSSLNSQINFIDANPIIYDHDISENKLQAEEELMVSASVFSNKGIKSVKVELTINDQEPQLMDLDFTPVANSIIVEETDLWSATLPPFGSSKNVLLKFIAEDNSGNISSIPELGITITSSSPLSKELLLNEIMSANSSIIMDQASEFDDWIEIYNPQSIAVNLSGKYLTDKVDNLNKWKFPDGMVINPNEYIIMWCDEDQEQGEDHTNFKLSASGEFLAIVDNDGFSIIDSITVPILNDDESYARDNEDNWIISSLATPGTSNLITDIDNEIIDRFSFKLNAYPNPFNPSTIIEYEIASPMKVELRIYDILGREVWNFRKEEIEAGNYKIEWNGRNINGGEISSGIYLAKIYGENYSKSIKLVLLR